MPSQGVALGPPEWHPGNRIVGRLPARPVQRGRFRLDHLCSQESPTIKRSASCTVVGLRLAAALAGLIVSGPGVPSPAVGADAVLCVASSRVELPIAVDLPTGMTVDPGATWRLSQEGRDLSVPAQIGSAVSADGTPEAGRQRLLAVLPASGDGPGERRFHLVKSDEAAAQVFAFHEITSASLQLAEGPRPVFVFNHGVITRGDLPEQEHRRSRSDYLHPLFGLSGEVLTDDFPRDHYHHHGVFWTWPHVLVDGTEHDLWAGATIAQRFGRFLVREAGPVAAVLGMENGWYVGEERVLIERVWIRAYRAAETDRALDMELYFTPLKPITLQGAEEKSYGGLAIRFAPGSRAETRIMVPSGLADDDLPDTRLKWADFTSRFGPMEHPSGAAMFVSPRHPDYPPTWLTRYYGAMCIGWPGVVARSFEPDVPFQLDYRLWLHRDAVDHGQLQEVYRGYTQAVDARWERVPHS